MKREDSGRIQGGPVAAGARGAGMVVVVVCVCLLGQARPAPARADEVPVPVKVRQVLLVGEDPAVLLLDEPGERYLLIFIDMFMATAIRMGMDGPQPERPLTHDLFGIVLRRLGAKVLRVHITALKGHTYHALIDMDTGEGEAQFDARPSDALALAVRGDAPILAEAALLKAVKPEERQAPDEPEREERKEAPRGAT